MKTLIEFSDRLEAERKRLKLDYQQVAEATGLTPLSVRHVLQGKSAPRITTLVSIADKLGLEVLLMPKVAASGLEASRGAAWPAPQSRVDRIVAETEARAWSDGPSTRATPDKPGGTS